MIYNPLKSKKVKVGDKLALVHEDLPDKGWSIHTKGYVIYTGRRHKELRGKNSSRLAMEILLGRKLSTNEIVHHMDFDKLNNCPCNLLLTTSEFNQHGGIQDPYTRKLISYEDYRRLYGTKVIKR